MKRLVSVPVLIFVIGLSVLLHAQEKPSGFKFDAKDIDGNWEGTLTIQVVKLRLAFKITKKPDGNLTGTMDSLDQGAKNIPLDSISLEAGKVRIEQKATKSVFEGKLNEAGTEIAGEWQQSGLKLPLTLKRVEKLTELKRPQEPKRPFPYAEEEVTFENAKAQVKLVGTLTLPKGDGPFPAAVLISGSGPQDRDETLMGHKPFLLLADYLTRRGIAVLRYDDRGVGKSTGKHSTATSVDFAEDVQAAVDFLKSRKEINAKQVGLIGHSEGGLIAPMVAAKSKDVAYIVLLAGPGLVGEEILYLQGQAILKAMGVPADKLAQQRELQRRIFTMVKEEKDPAAAEMKLKEIIDAEVAKLSEEEKKAIGGMLDAAGAQAKLVLTPWFRNFLTYDPRPTLMQVQCPVLALIGEKDLHVPPKENLPALEQALQAGGNRDFLAKELPGLNHLLQTCKTGTVLEYSEIEETMAPAALELIAEWIQKRTTK
jgi:hypothetical protein